MVNVSEQGYYQGKPREDSKDDKKLKSILVNSKNIGEAREIISTLSRDSRQELKAILLTTGRNDYYELRNKLTEKDVEKLLELLGEADEKVTLYKTEELRPITWSKTVTLFDVYETDEENFIPYISPLATVGQVNTGSTGSDSETTDIGQSGDIDVSGIDGTDVNGGEAQGESKGLLGLGFMGL